MRWHMYASLHNGRWWTYMFTYINGWASTKVSFLFILAFICFHFLHYCSWCEKSSWLFLKRFVFISLGMHYLMSWAALYESLKVVWSIYFELCKIIDPVLQGTKMKPNTFYLLGLNFYLHTFTPHCIHEASQEVHRLEIYVMNQKSWMSIIFMESAKRSYAQLINNLVYVLHISVLFYFFIASEKLQAFWVIILRYWDRTNIPYSLHFFVLRE